MPRGKATFTTMDLGSGEVKNVDSSEVISPSIGGIIECKEISDDIEVKGKLDTAKSILGHAGLGAGIGAITGAASSDKGKGTSGAIRGALAGAGIGAAGGAVRNKLGKVAQQKVNNLEKDIIKANNRADAAAKKAKGKLKRAHKRHQRISDPNNPNPWREHNRHYERALNKLQETKDVYGKHVRTDRYLKAGVPIGAGAAGIAARDRKNKGFSNDLCYKELSDGLEIKGNKIQAVRKVATWIPAVAGGAIVATPKKTKGIVRKIIK